MPIISSSPAHATQQMSGDGLQIRQKNTSSEDKPLQSAVSDINQHSGLSTEAKRAPTPPTPPGVGNGEQGTAVSRPRPEVHTPLKISPHSMHQLFKVTAELAESQKIPQSQRHSPQDSAEKQTENQLNELNRELTKAIKESGPLRGIELSAMIRSPETAYTVAKQTAKTQQEVSGGQVEQIANMEKVLTMGRIVNSPQAQGIIKLALCKKLESSVGPEQAAVMSAKFIVLNTSTNYEKNLQPVNTETPSEKVSAEEQIPPLNKPMLKAETVGTCFGRVSQCISRVAKGAEMGENLLDSVRAGSVDQGNIVSGALKQKIYANLWNGAQETIEDEFNYFSRYSNQLREFVANGLMTQEEMNDSQLVAAEKIEDREDYLDSYTNQLQQFVAKGLMTQQEMDDSLKEEQSFDPLNIIGEAVSVAASEGGIGLDGSVVKTSRDFNEVVEPVLKGGGMTLMIGNEHAIGVVEQGGIHCIVDPSFGTTITPSPEVAKELIAIALNTGKESPFSAVNFGPVPTAAPKTS